MLDGGLALVAAVNGVVGVEGLAVNEQGVAGSTVASVNATTAIMACVTVLCVSVTCASVTCTSVTCTSVKQLE